MSAPAGRPGVLRVANCSGFFGDRAHAAREMVEGGPIDVLTGDWLAELTMYILHKTRERSGGYARTFLRELEEVLPACVERGISVVANAGGLQPGGAGGRRGGVGPAPGTRPARGLGLGRRHHAHLATLRAQGEEFVNLDTGERLPAGATVVTANAYLRARPIADALAAGAQVVVTGRVTDAALVVGPALHAFGWSDSDLDAIAGAVVAGHVIECGAQCCGGNYAFFEDVPGRERIGFPLAEVHADGSSVITKHPGTGGMVTVGTVTAQLLYEIGGPRYLSPDAVARFDSIGLSQEGPDRVRIGPVRGEAPPATLKVTANLDAGWRNAMTLALTGAQVAEKARFAAAAVWAGVPGGPAGFAETAEDLSGDLTGDGMAYLRLAVRGDDQHAVGRAFSGAVVETSLSSYPGTFFTSAPSGAQGVARYWPTTVRAAAVTPRIECDGRSVTPTPLGDLRSGAAARAAGEEDAARDPGGETGDRVAVPLWVLVGARSGDKGGDANVGVWADDDAVADWLQRGFSVEAFKAVLPEVERVRGQPVPAPQPAGGELRRPRPSRLGRGLEPASGQPGEGPWRAPALTPHGGAVRAGGVRSGGGEAHRKLTAGPDRPPSCSSPGGGSATHVPPVRTRFRTSRSALRGSA